MLISSSRATRLTAGLANALPVAVLLVLSTFASFIVDATGLTTAASTAGAFASGSAVTSMSSLLLSSSVVIEKSGECTLAISPCL